MQNEESVLEWLIDDENRELADEIEEVNERMLERLLDESLYLAVLFCKYSKGHDPYKEGNTGLSFAEPTVPHCFTLKSSRG